MRRVSILLALLAVMASGAWSEAPQSAKDYFPREGVIKTYRIAADTRPDIRQTYSNRGKFRDMDATVVTVDAPTPLGKTETLLHYYRVLDDRWSLLGTRNPSRNLTVIYEPAITQFRVPLKAGDTWRENYTQRIVESDGKEERASCSTTFTIYGRESIRISGRTYYCWKAGYDTERDGKPVAKVVTWIAKKYGTVRRTVHYPNGKVVDEHMDTFRDGNSVKTRGT